MKIELTHQEISALVASILFMTKDILETEGFGDEKVMLVDCYTSIINKITEDEDEDDETITGVITRPKSALEDLIEFSKEFVENKL
jgi:hypothetical protein